MAGGKEMLTIYGRIVDREVSWLFPRNGCHVIRAYAICIVLVYCFMFLVYIIIF